MKRKWKALCICFFCAFALLVSAQVSYAADVPTESTELIEPTETPQKETYTVKIKFNKNGGKGTMGTLTVTSDKNSVKLIPNKYRMTGYTFAGWSFEQYGAVTYKNKENVASLATEENDGETITLYAQWKPNTPTIKKATSKTPSYIDVTFKKSTGISGYTIQYSTNKKFKKNVATATAGKNDTSARLMNVVPNKKYYVRICSYKEKNGTQVWCSDWSKVLSVKVKNGKTLMNTKAAYGIEADVKLNGSGSGYHAKLVIGTPSSAVSFGMQYDVGAANPYGSRNMALIENVASNNPGDQQYVRPGDFEFQLNKYYHLMITVDKNGKGAVYVDYKQIGTFKQSNLKNTNPYLWLEVSGRLNGDGVDAEFANIRFTDQYSGISTLGKDGKPYDVCRHDKTNAGLKCKYNKKTNTVRMYGKIKNLSGDWDSAYNGVSYRLHLK